jgi:hypothetical protein
MRVSGNDRKKMNVAMLMTRIAATILLSALLVFCFAGCKETASSKDIGVTYGVCSEPYNCQYGATFALSGEHGAVEITLIATPAVTSGTSDDGTITLPGGYGPYYTNTLPGSIISLFSTGVYVITTAVVYDTRYYDEHQDELRQAIIISHIAGLDTSPVVYNVRLIDSKRKEITRGTIPIGETTMVVSSEVHYIEVTAPVGGQLIGSSPTVGYDNAHELSDGSNPTVPNTAVDTTSPVANLSPVDRAKAKMEFDGYDTSNITFEIEGEEVVNGEDCYIVRASWPGSWVEAAQQYQGGGSYAYAVPKNSELDVTHLPSRTAGGNPKPK